MNDNGRIDAPAEPSADKFERHYRQQLSALVDGELATDEARFLLRRLQHDDELAGCQERWQLLGDALRGNACAPAPADFGLRVRQAIAADAAQAVAAVPQRTSHAGWRRWGGGAALAASVAAVALFMAREQVPAPAEVPTVIATTAQVPAATLADARAPRVDAGLAAVAAPVAAPVLSSSPRGNAGRVPPVARGTVARAPEPGRALVAQAPATPALRADPFADAAGVLQARPWPRSTLAPALSHSTLSASLQTSEGGATFYPFEPQMPAQAPAETDTQVPRH